MIASPCTNVCRMHPATGWCEGCARTIDEIIAWSRATDAVKQQILARLPERRTVLVEQHAVLTALAPRDPSR